MITNFLRNRGVFRGVRRSGIIEKMRLLRKFSGEKGTSKGGVNSEESDEDFKSKEKINLEDASEKEVLQHIDEIVKANKVVLFMKGSPEAPQCGYSQFVSGAISFYSKIIFLKEKLEIDNFHHVDILRSPEMRKLVKVYSDWPTFPQLYVDGELIGGADIVSEMHKDGSLKEVFDGVGED